jgi:hypothetical protein
MSELPEAKKTELLKLCLRQRELADEIDLSLKENAPSGPQFARDFFRQLPDDLALEFLRFCLAPRASLTRPQLERALQAVRDFLPGKRFSLSKDYYLHMYKYYFVIEES